MWVVYVLQVLLILTSAKLQIYDFEVIPLLVLVFIGVFVIHELLHILTIYRIGDISLTHSGIFFWLNTNAELSKPRFWLFMTLPLLGLTVLPFAASIWFTGYLHHLLLYIAWINLIIGGADLVNSLLILVKPRGTVFCRGFYKKKSV